MARSGPVRVTAEKFKQLKNELEERLTVGRRRIADRLEQYRKDDRSDDTSAYSEALEEKRWMEQRIDELEDTLEDAVITKQQCDLDKVSLGCSVKVKRNGGEMTFVIVPSLDADPSKHKISEKSPVGKALLGKKVGDTVIVNSPEAKCNCKILEISIVE